MTAKAKDEAAKEMTPHQKHEIAGAEPTRPGLVFTPAMDIFETEAAITVLASVDTIAGEIASFVRDGVQNVLCLQPFGCIANHVIAKGVQKRLKEKYPQLNLLFLDADAGVSEVNFFNRMHFFVNRARTVHYGDG